MNTIAGIADRIHSCGPDTWAEVLAQELGWRGEIGQTAFVQQRLGPLYGGKALFRGEPAILFVAPDNDTDAQSRDERYLHSAALAAYHATIDWGILTSTDGLTLFNSRWVRNRDWFRLPHLSWGELSNHSDLIEALSPAGVSSGVLPRIVTQRFYAADEYLRPVDEELVRRLDEWRRRALAVAESSEGVDEALQRLFAQFFVLRAVEDRELAPGLVPLQSAVRGRLVDRSALGAIFHDATERVQADLFADAPSNLIADEVVAGVITDLYAARNLPIPAQYNFAWLDADVLGRAYEKYLSRVLEPLPPPAQQDLFGTVRRVGERDVRKQEGVYYTPSYLVRSLVAQAIDSVLDQGMEQPVGPVTPSAITSALTTAALEHTAAAASDEPSGLPYIADFACGSGGFLVAAADYLLRKLREKDPNHHWAHDLIEGRHIVGIDKDPRAVTLTRLNLYIRLTSEPESLPLPSLDRCVVQGDSLSDEPWDSLPLLYDVVLGNPPFIASEHQMSRAELTRRFETAQGRFDFAFLFVELAIRKLKPHGVLSLVVPNRLFRNRDAGAIRNLLTDQSDLLCIVDFESHEVFKGVSAYIGTITARRRAATDPEPSEVRVVRVLAVDETSFMGALITRAAEESGDVRNDVLDAFAIPHPRGELPWLLLPPSARERRLSLSMDSVQLGELATAKQGIRTGANDIFILTVQSAASGYARVVNEAGEGATLETGLLRQVVFGTEIQRYDLVSARRVVLYPYRNGVAIEEAEMREKYPRTWEYLSRYRNPLGERSSIGSSGIRWYELIRKRDQAWLDMPKLVIRDLVLDMAFAIDPSGDTYLIGGTAVIPADEAFLWPLLGYLNTGLVADYLRQTTPAFRGGFQKIEPRHLESLPVPTQLLSSTTANAIGNAARRAVEAKLAGRRDELEAAEREADAIVEELVANSSKMPFPPTHDRTSDGEGITYGDQ